MIRPSTPSNLEDVLKIWLEDNLDANPSIPEDYWFSHYEMVSQALLSAKLYVFVTQDYVLGFTGMQGDYLAGIFVDRRYRPQGVGRQLLDHLKMLFPSFTLKVYQKNTDAVQFYLRKGLEVISKDRDPDTNELELLMKWNAPVPQ